MSILVIYVHHYVRAMPSAPIYLLCVLVLDLNASSHYSKSF